MKLSEESNIGELVAEDYRTASVFESFGIDFCCKGNRSINEVCEERGIKTATLIEDLNTALAKENAGSIDYTQWPLDLLVDYIEKKHHRYVEKQIPILKQYLGKIASVHGKNHPELYKINDMFIESAGEFTAHMKKEELLLFPYIKKLVNAQLTSSAVTTPGFGTVENPIESMMADHLAEGDRFREISELSNNYTAPADGCNTYKVSYALLKEFEADLHVHIHLENNILFPKAIQLEKSLKN